MVLYSRKWFIRQDLIKYSRIQEIFVIIILLTIIFLLVSVRSIIPIIITHLTPSESLSSPGQSRTLVFDYSRWLEFSKKPFILWYINFAWNVAWTIVFERNSRHSKPDKFNWTTMIRLTASWVSYNTWWESQQRELILNRSFQWPKSSHIQPNALRRNFSTMAEQLPSKKKFFSFSSILKKKKNSQKDQKSILGYSMSPWCESMVYESMVYDLVSDSEWIFPFWVQPKIRPMIRPWCMTWCMILSDSEWTHFDFQPFDFLDLQNFFHFWIL